MTCTLQGLMSNVDIALGSVLVAARLCGAFGAVSQWILIITIIFTPFICTAVKRYKANTFVCHPLDVTRYNRARNRLRLRSRGRKRRRTTEQDTNRFYGANYAVSVVARTR